jgi:hypothetical protein
MSLHYINLQASHGCIRLQSQLPISTRTGTFPWFWGVYRRVFTHVRLTWPGQHVKREKLCLPNVHYEVWSQLPCYWAYRLLWSVERTPLCWQRLFLDARVADLTRLYRPIFGTISPWRPFCFNGPDNEGRCVGHVEAEDPGIQ